MNPKVQGPNGTSVRSLWKNGDGKTDVIIMDMKLGLETFSIRKYTKLIK